MMYHLKFGFDGVRCSGAGTPALCGSESFALDLISSLISVLLTWRNNGIPNQHLDLKENLLSQSTSRILPPRQEPQSFWHEPLFRPHEKHTAPHSAPPLQNSR